MSIPRLGYACINTSLSGGFKNCIAKTFESRGQDYAIGLARHNLQTVLRILEWNEEMGIRLYRMSSDMFPHLTNPQFLTPKFKYAYPLDQFNDLFKEIGQFAKKYNHRLTFHPSQFNQVGAIDKKVFEKTSLELEAHAEILDRIGCGPESVMVVHGGGVYGNKKATIERWIKQFWQLPENVRNRLVIENCERQYTYADMLYISSQINRPVVFDTHHHACYSENVAELPDPSTFINDIIKTWTCHSLIPKMHISEQAIGKRVGAHSDYVEDIPQYLLNVLQTGQDLDLMIEAKAKEKAVLHLYEMYYRKDVPSFQTSLATQRKDVPSFQTSRATQWTF